MTYKHPYPIPEWIAPAIVGFKGAHTDPTPEFVAAAAERVWNQLIERGLHTRGLAESELSSNVPVIVIPVEVTA